ncbi:hypothetical protein P7K49_017189 [Saguinus oedipus]|uniref:Uncharacterized protein n=1 Tax=Saguinus oedipus TaxID=9490 RepID=A0ABQ9V1U5_SAGOE|nr:hypothetical protein P7K49_017189 [Saguinus oedipus]
METTQNLVDPDMAIVNKTACDLMVVSCPKPPCTSRSTMCMHCLMGTGSSCGTGDAGPEKLIEEPAEQAQRRVEMLCMHHVLRELLSLISDINTTTVNTPMGAHGRLLAAAAEGPTWRQEPGPAPMALKPPAFMAEPGWGLLEQALCPSWQMRVLSGAVREGRELMVYG